VERAVQPILNQVGQEHDLDDLHDEPLRTDPGAQLIPMRAGQDGNRGGHRNERQYLHQQAANQVIEKIFAPVGAEEGLVFMPGEEAFDGDEQEAGEDDVQYEPVEAKINVAGQFPARLHIRSTQYGCQQDNADGGETEDFVGAENQTDDRHCESADQQEVQTKAKGGGVIDIANRRYREQRRITNAKDKKQPGDGSDQSRDSA
jgi:hypothetical protein